MSFYNKVAACSALATLVSFFLWSCSHVSVNSPAQMYSNLNCDLKSNNNNPNRNNNSSPPSQRYGLLASELGGHKQARVLCWILSAANRTENEIKVAAVNGTWARRCDKFLVVRGGGNASDYTETDGVLTVPVQESRPELWHKVVKAFSYAHRRYLNSFDWFMKADDDTYVFVDTLKRFLGQQDPNKAIYFGHKFKPYVKQGYMSGGAGYVLSRAALDKLVRVGFSDATDKCNLNKGSVEDVEMGWCLEKLGVEAGDSRDATKRPTFNGVDPEYLLALQRVDNSSWYFRYSFYGNQGVGRNCCSSEPISFHYVSPNEMLLIDWLTYDVGATRQQNSLAAIRAT